MTRRIVAIGGLGGFGSIAIDLLRAAGHAPLTASRRPGAELRIDVEDPDSLRRLERRDVVLDAAGPFQSRSSRLFEAAVRIGFDVVDLSDSPAYALKAIAMADRFEAAGIAVLTSCSSLSAISAAVVRAGGFADPECVRALLRPASRETARPATVASLLASVGRPIRVLRGGRLETRIGWRERRGSGGLVEGCDAVLLPRAWPSIREAGFYVDANVPGLDAVLGIAARLRWARDAFARVRGPAARAAALLGSRRGRFSVEVVSASGETFRAAFESDEQSPRIAVAPAVLAVKALADGRFAQRGLVPCHRQSEPEELFAYLASIGIRVSMERGIIGGSEGWR
jgi:short subunit dehydrogenase-like uncharacterized protein